MHSSEFQQIFQTVKIIISEHAAIEQENVTLNTPIFASMRLPFSWSKLPRTNNNLKENPLGLDELDEIEMIQALEKKFRIEISEQVIYEYIITVEALVEYIVSLL